MVSLRVVATATGLFAAVSGAPTGEAPVGAHTGNGHMGLQKEREVKFWAEQNEATAAEYLLKKRMQMGKFTTHDTPEEAAAFHLSYATKCIDDHSECAKWAEKEECKNNAVWMLANCRVSCNVCKAEEGAAAAALPALLPGQQEATAAAALPALIPGQQEAKAATLGQQEAA